MSFAGATRIRTSPNRHGKGGRTLQTITFSKEVASRGNSGFEFVAPGHPLLEALNGATPKDR